jgi:glycosyltransferase involved in cell wall biosynthesis
VTPDTGDPELSVVMPAHNVAEFLEQSIADVVTGLRARGDGFELIVVENGSTDGTLDVARCIAEQTPEVRVRTFPSPDYGEALRTGILASTGEIVVTFDVDFYDLEFLDQALARLRSDNGPAIVIASKRAAGTRDLRPWPRRSVTAVFTIILRVGFGLRASDTHGMKAMRRRTVEPIARRCHFGTDLFDTELVLRAERAGVAIAQLPVSVEERRPSRTPIWRRVVRTLVGLARLRIMLTRESHAR